MSTRDEIATVDELFEFVHGRFREEYMPYAHEWLHATVSGWDDDEFEQLYRAYVDSTQQEINSSDDATEIKGRPLEEVARYFLRQGGVVTSIREISEHGRWQVDGQGPLNKTAIQSAWGEDICRRIGFEHRGPGSSSSRRYAWQIRRRNRHSSR